MRFGIYDPMGKWIYIREASRSEDLLRMFMADSHLSPEAWQTLHLEGYAIGHPPPGLSNTKRLPAHHLVVLRRLGDDGNTRRTPRMDQELWWIPQCGVV